MLSATIQKRWEALPEISKQGKKINGLFRLMMQPDLWMQAYGKIYSNKGANTPGVEGISQDGFSMDRVTNTIDLLKEGRYTFSPARRVYIPKKGGKRPLGIPDGDDKLVQEVCRTILERIYEPVFSDESHGFRPGRSCLTALSAVRQWDGFVWIVEMDIKGFYDNIDHKIMVKTLEDRIDDKRFINLIKSMLKAGHMDDLKFHQSYSGAPQGSGASPILSNIYLNELDKFMRGVCEGFEKGKARARTSAYNMAIKRIRRQKERELAFRDQGVLPGLDEARREPLKDLQESRRSIPAGDQMDQDFRRLRYCRYADDFIIGIIGSLEDAKEVYARVEQFLNEELHLEVAPEKSKISHSEDGTLFLGHNVRMYTGNKVMKVKNHLKRTIVKRMQLHVPRDRMVQLMKGGKFGDYEHGWASHNSRWLQREDVEILLAYNAVIRGFVNYYSLIVSPNKELGKLVWLMQVSFLKTLAHKHKSTVAKTAKKLRLSKGDLGIQVEASKGRRTYKLFSMKDFQRIPKGTDVDVKPNVATILGSRTSLVRRLQAETCEFCEQEGGYLEIHHVRKLKDVQKGKASWQKQMAEMRRKTLVLCVKCHDELHAGTLADRRRKT